MSLLFVSIGHLLTVNKRYGKDGWEELYGPVFKGLFPSTTAVIAITTNTAGCQRFLTYLSSGSSRKRRDSEARSNEKTIGFT